MTTRRKTLPALSPKAPAELRPLMAAMAEILETGEGVRGDKLDRKLTLRDVLDGGVARLRIPGNPEGGLSANVPVVDMSVPPAPTGFLATGSFFGMINLSWDPPHERYNNHAYTNIYRADTDDFGQAQLVGREAGMFFSDLVRDDVAVVEDPLNLPGFFYWITFTSTNNVEGPPNSPNGKFARPLQDVRYLLGTLSKSLADEPADLGSPEETLILNAKRFAIRLGAGSEAVYPLIVQDIGGVPTVVLDTALIAEASIQEGQIGPISFGKVIGPDGQPITTLAGKLRADMLDVDSLRVGDANISGVLKSSATDSQGRPRWQLDKAGGFQLNGGGTGGRTEIQENLIRMWYPNGRLLLRMGNW